MVIAVERGLNDIKKYLEYIGYTVVDGYSYRGPIDAYVYENMGFSAVDDFNSYSQSSSQSEGMLIVNAKNKSPEEIADILKNRVYGENINFIWFCIAVFGNMVYNKLMLKESDINGKKYISW